jgi:uncharacterized protein (DUF952 family)
MNTRHERKGINKIKRMIHHIAGAENWKKALEQGFYEADSLAKEGFMHCCRAEQVGGVLERYFKGQTGLVLLNIDETRLVPALRYELSPSVNEVFPHVFGRLNLDAVTGTELI